MIQVQIYAKNISLLRHSSSIYMLLLCLLLYCEILNISNQILEKNKKSGGYRMDGWMGGWKEGKAF